MGIHEADTAPQVSVIVPARNEEASLGDCLQSLVAQTGVTHEIIVVDDGSTDRTRQIALSFPGVLVVDAGPLPEGWTGKCNALISGSSHARAEWLLFTDADTVHRPGSLSESLSEALRHHASLLSYSPEQEVHGFWEKAVMPVIFAELAATYRPSLVSDPRSSAAAANGQYLLISRAAYDAVGRHGAIATEILEDVALARSVKKSGRKIFFRYGADAVKTRMYRNWSQLREGWTKNLALLFRHPVQLALLRALEFALILGCLAIAVVKFTAGKSPMAAVTASIAALLYGIFLRRIRKAHFSWDSTLLAIFGLPLFASLLLLSNRAHQKGRLTWKDRNYPGKNRWGQPPKPALSGAEGDASPNQARHGGSASKLRTGTTPAA